MSSASRDAARGRRKAEALADDERVRAPIAGQRRPCFGDLGDESLARRRGGVRVAEEGSARRVLDLEDERVRRGSDGRVGIAELVDRDDQARHLAAQCVDPVLLRATGIQLDQQPTVQRRHRPHGVAEPEGPLLTGHGIDPRDSAVVLVRDPQSPVGVRHLVRARAGVVRSDGLPRPLLETVPSTSFETQT